MSNQFDYFSDLLDSEESVQATLAGPGPDASGSAVWHQVAVTETRLLAVELRATASGSWRPHQRTTAPLSRIQMDRHERTDAAPARLVIHGLEHPVTVTRIDQPDVFPMVEPLVVAWGGRLGGTGTERPAPAPAHPPASPTGAPAAATTTNQRTLLIVLGCIGLMIAGCATAGCLGVIVTAALEPT